jgi:dipeptidyl aminopeptidase/acylaminoacyl peptidase
VEKRLTGRQMSRDGGTFVVGVSDGDRPADLYAADPGFRNMRRLTDLNAALLAGVSLPRSELIAYRDVDGKEPRGVLRYPVSYVTGRKVPTVFELYETFFDNGFNARATFLANHGCAVFHPSVNLVVGRPGEAWVKGVTAAANRLIDLGIAPASRSREIVCALRRLARTSNGSAASTAPIPRPTASRRRWTSRTASSPGTTGT